MSYSHYQRQRKRWSIPNTEDSSQAVSSVPVVDDKSSTHSTPKPKCFTNARGQGIVTHLLIVNDVPGIPDASAPTVPTTHNGPEFINHGDNYSYISNESPALPTLRRRKQWQRQHVPFELHRVEVDLHQPTKDDMYFLSQVLERSARERAKRKKDSELPRQTLSIKERMDRMDISPRTPKKAFISHHMQTQRRHSDILPRKSQTLAPSAFDSPELYKYSFPFLLILHSFN